MQAQNKTEGWWLALARRAVVISVLSWAMMGLYLFINHRPSATITTVEMPSWVPFSPWFLPPYLGLLFLTWFLPVALQNQERFRACALAYVCAWVLVIPWWVLTPTMLARPPLPEGFWSHAFSWLWTVDQPYNVTPCAHAVGPIIGVWFASREYPAWRWHLTIVLLLALPSIALVWQHRPVDILLGAVAASIGIAIAEGVASRGRGRAAGLDGGVAGRGNAVSPSAVDA
jgi:hypothetical protein